MRLLSDPGRLTKVCIQVSLDLQPHANLFIVLLDCHRLLFYYSITRTSRQTVEPYDITMHPPNHLLRLHL